MISWYRLYTLQSPKLLLALMFSAVLIACGGGGGGDDDDEGDSSSSSGGGSSSSGSSSSGGSSSGGGSTGCIDSSFSDGAYFIGSFTGIEPEPTVTAFNETNSETACGGLGMGEGYSIAFQVDDPGDPNDGQMQITIDVNGTGAIPMVAADQAADVRLILPLNATPDRGGFFNGVECFVTITAVPEEPDQVGGRLFYPEGTFICSRFEADLALTVPITGPQPDILITPSDSVVQFLGAVGVIDN
ncbi:MAG: hypothetical protein AAF434_07350 [Pseudomonadota bacterium]